MALLSQVLLSHPTPKTAATLLMLISRLGFDPSSRLKVPASLAAKPRFEGGALGSLALGFANLDGNVSKDWEYILRV